MLDSLQLSELLPCVRTDAGALVPDDITGCSSLVSFDSVRYLVCADSFWFAPLLEPSSNKALLFSSFKIPDDSTLLCRFVIK